MNNLKPLLEVKGLKKHFPITGGLLGRTVGYVKAVDGVTFDIMDGETLSLVGESGSGKTTTGKAILRLNKPTTGSVLFEDEDILGMKGEKMRRMRRKMQIIFQDPYGSLNPRLPVGEIIGEPLVVHNLASRKEREEQVMEIMETV
ncbi:MAG TPA: ATP-binding cassette domain-containing protein, partial [Caldisericia bacterium]|nr:ATP-binding cassette domain-containing protein [Caldisericia bacterium]